MAAMQPSGGSLPQLLLFPFNGNAIEALDCAAGAFAVVGFIDDSPDKIGREYHGVPVLTREALAEHSDAMVLAVPGSPRSYRDRAGIINGLLLAPERYAQVIHRGATVSSQADVGHNVLIMAGVVVTSNARIHHHVCILPNTVVHHDVVVGAWSLIGSNVSVAGGVILGENCYVGSGASIRDGVRIGDGALVGLGSTVTRHVPPYAVVVGSPAKELGQP